MTYVASAFMVALSLLVFLGLRTYFSRRTIKRKLQKYTSLPNDGKHAKDRGLKPVNIALERHNTGRPTHAS